MKDLTVPAQVGSQLKDDETGQGENTISTRKQGGGVTVRLLTEPQWTFGTEEVWISRVISSWPALPPNPQPP